MDATSAELHRRAVVPDQRVPPRLHEVEGMTPLMEERAHVIVHSHGVHEYVRPAGHGKALAIAARRFVGPGFQVEEAVPHDVEVGCQYGVNLLEDAMRACHQLCYVIEWL